MMLIDNIDVELTGEKIGGNEAAVYVRQFQQNHPTKRIKRIEIHVGKASVDGKLWFMPVSFERIPRITGGAPKHGHWKQLQTELGKNKIPPIENKKIINPKIKRKRKRNRS